MSTDGVATSRKMEVYFLFGSLVIKVGGQGGEAVVHPMHTGMRHVHPHTAGMTSDTATPTLPLMVLLPRQPPTSQPPLLLLSRATPLSSIGHALLLALLHWVWFSLGWHLQPPPSPCLPRRSPPPTAWATSTTHCGRMSTS